MKLLKIVTEEEMLQYSKLMIDVEYSDMILDVFSHSLTVGECENTLMSYKDLNLKNEYKYISLFKELFMKNLKSNLIIKFNLKELEDYQHINILDELDRYEKHLWVNQMIQLDRNLMTDIFRVDDIDILKMLVQINVRELEFIEFYFLDLGFVIKGSFDCAMEVFFKDSKDIKKLEKCVKSHELYLRNI
jgi:hypothetical protein